jgi:hypothetical protein
MLVLMKTVLEAKEKLVYCTSDLREEKHAVNEIVSNIWC